MATRINPPVFKSARNYERYKQELLAWREITDLSEYKQGIAIALSLPEDDSQIRDKVFDHIPIIDLKSFDGFNVLIRFLDKHLAKDDLTDSLEKFEDFDDFRRSEGQSISEFIALFDTKYQKIVKKNMVLPPEILAFKLLRKANITPEEKLLVLTGMNYEQKETLYEEAKKSLKKFKGGKTVPDGGVRLEPAYFTSGEESVLAAGYSRSRGRGYSSCGSSCGSWRRGNFGSQQRFGGYQKARVTVNADRGGPKKNMNPLGPDGNPKVCSSCGSYRHLLSACPDSWENMAKVKIVEDEHAVLFTGYNKEEVRRLGVDARNCAILDSACSSTVCGDNWINNYIQSLNEGDRSRVKCTAGQKVFKFGGGTCMKSKGEYSLPAVVAGKEVIIHTDVVESDIPLLLSRTAMKKAAIKLDLENDTANIMGQEVALNLTSSGHYCIPIDKSVEVPVESVCAVSLDVLSQNDRQKTLLKLHRQFARPSKKRLIALLKDAGVWNDEYEDTLSKIVDSCDLCKMYAKTPSRPVVGMPMATKFNEKVAMDLKHWEGRWILHIIDMWSRYTLSVFVDRKKPRDIIDALMTQWIGKFGVMNALMTDNGGEFNSNEMREIASILNVQLCTTAGESPFQNGLCERVHAMTDTMLVKLVADYGKYNTQTLLSWANMARNSLQMWNGFSSHQLVFGENPNLPNIMTEELPALQGMTSSEVFAEHLNALHASRRVFIETEADERIRRALRNKVRAAEQVFENRDLVFYKREGKERWLGPGKVVFQDGKVVFVRHGAVFVRVSPNRLQKISRNVTDDHNNNDEHEQELTTDEPNEQTAVDDQHTISEDLPAAVQAAVAAQENNASKKVLKTNDNIQFKLSEDDIWVQAKVLGRAGKGTGKNKHWYNIQENASGEKKSINLEQVQWQIINEDVNVNAILKRTTGNEDTGAAKCVELQKLYHFETYEEVNDNGQQTLSTRWVITNKDGRTKARLVVRGFEEDFEMQRDSPTVGKGTMRLFLAISAINNWTISTTDIKSAFLQGRELLRDVYIKPPKESDTKKGMIWKLKHGLYGLKDGVRQFYMSVKEELLRLGCKMCEIDPAMFFLHKDGRLRGIICCHVDDFLHAGDELLENIMKSLRKRFVAGKIEKKNFSYIGFQISQESSKIILDQSRYVSNIENKVLDPKRAQYKQNVLTEEEQTEYRKLIGKLNWAVQGTRPDMAFELIELSTKLKDMKSLITFPDLSKTAKDWKILVFTDASLCNLNNEIKWCPGKIHMADCLTKRGSAGFELLEVLAGGRMPEEFM